MNCQEFRKALHDYCARLLPPESALRVDEHAASCGGCGSLLAAAREISCRDFVEFLNQYLDDELPADRKEVFERHLAICKECRQYLATYRETIALAARALAPDTPLPPLPEDLVKAILAARKR